MSDDIALTLLKSLSINVRSVAQRLGGAIVAFVVYFIYARNRELVNREG